MKNMIKTIKSLFVKDKNSINVDYENKIDMVCGTIFRRVRSSNISNFKYTFSIIPVYRNIMIKCQAADNTSIWKYLNLTVCCAYSKEELTNYIDKELNSLYKQIDDMCSNYKENKNEKDN